MKVSQILDNIDIGQIALPEFQRGYVWSRDQVRGFMDSLYRNHPVGSLLVWVTTSESTDVRGGQDSPPGVVKLLLDGQQRITSLYGIIQGKPPKFFDGNEKAFLDLYFHLDDETFEFYGPVKMKQDPRWVSVTDVMNRGVMGFFKRINEDPELSEGLELYMERLNSIANIKNRFFQIEEVTGADKTVDIVVDIFNRVNSGGTKLSKGDLALARICAEWPEAREEMQARLTKWRKVGFHFKLDWLLRNINTVLTGEAMFRALKDVKTSEFREALTETEGYIDLLLNLIGSRLGLDHDRVLGSPYSFPLMARYLAQRGGKLSGSEERDRLLFWYVHTLLWGRYAGSTESVLNQDLGVIEENEGALGRLMGLLRQVRGDLRLHPNDFVGWSRGARFYPFLYMLSRVSGSKDWETGVDLRKGLLGGLSGLQLHHVFPKARLYEAGYMRPEVNALANFTFLTQATNLQISDRDPTEYLPEFAEKNPGVLESHWIPMDPSLWAVDRYSDFLAARRELLAGAGNQFLEKLFHGTVPEAAEAPEVPSIDITGPQVVPGAIDTDEELETLVELADWAIEEGLAEGGLEFELVDQETGQALAVLDLAWPEGLQPSLSQPVAVLLDESTETEKIANQAGFRSFTEPESFRRYVRREILGEVVAAAD